MSTITVIGSGNVGSAVAAVAAKGGAAVQILSRDSERAAELAAQVGGSHGAIGDEIAGDIVVLALPFGAMDEAIDSYQAQLDGKVVVDVSNPVNLETFDSLTVPADSSAAAQIQAKLPGAKVLKAFNTLFAASLAAGTVGDQPATVLIAGDDEEARAALARVVTDGGVEAVEVGGLARARELEAFGFLQITMMFSKAIGPTGGFALRP